MNKQEKSQVEQDRLDKLNKLQEQKINAYPSKSGRNFSCLEALNNFDTFSKTEKKITLAGRIRSLRGHGALTFATLQDGTSKIQIAFDKKILGAEKYKLISEILDIGDFIDAKGVLFVTHKKEKTLKIFDWKILTKTLLPLPDKWHGLKDEEQLFRKRYLDILMNPEIKKMFVKKSRYYESMREFLKSKNFLEVETPVLENTTGGADASPFATHHNALDIDAYLRISVGELWQKRLMVAGFDKTFEIGRIFRNEGMDAEHLQDYTSMEFYWAYANWEDGMKLVEDLVKYIAKETFDTLKFKIKNFDIDLNKKWERYDYREEVKKQTKIDIEKTDVKEIKNKLKKLEVEFDDFQDLGSGIDQLWKYCRKQIAGPGYLVYPPKIISPLAKESEEKPGYAERYQLILAGSELCNGYSELNNPLDQEERFKQQAELREKGNNEAQMHDEEFVEALKYGMPPTTGLGISERLFSFLMNKTGRECQIFPLMRPKKSNKIQLDLSYKIKKTNLPKSEIPRKKCWELVEKYILPERRAHLLAVESAMRALAKHFNEDEHTWAMCGLLHDIDYDKIPSKENMEEHMQAHCGKMTEDFLSEINFPKELIRVIQSHNELTKIPRDSKLAKALFAVDGLTGFITAIAKIYPDKKIELVKVKSITKRMKEKRFAVAVNRDHIKSCETELDLPLNEFAEIVLDAMKKISDDLGL